MLNQHFFHFMLLIVIMLYKSGLLEVSGFKNVLLRRNRYSRRIRHFGIKASTEDVIANNINLNIDDISNGISSNPLPVNIYVDSDVRRYLKMKNHESKSRVNICLIYQ